MSSSARQNLSLAEKLRNEQQLESFAGDQFFSEEPVDLNTFIHDKKYMNQPKLTLGKHQFDFIRHMEQVYLPSTYPYMVETFGAQWEPVRFVNLLSIQWGKGSQHPFSLVYDANTGQWVTLKSLENREVLVASAYAEEGKISTYRGTTSFKEGEGEMYRVITARGNIKDVWEGHRFLTRPRDRKHRIKQNALPTWARLWDMRIGDSIAVPKVVPEPENVEWLPANDVELIGLFIGDGCSAAISHNASICGGAKSVATLARTEYLLSALPNSVIRRATRADGKWDVVTRSADRKGGATNP